MFKTKTFALLLALMTTIMACADTVEEEQPVRWPTEPLAQGQRFVKDKSYRRHILEQSIVEKKNGYSQLRLQNYGVEKQSPKRSWDDVTIWNPPVRPIVQTDIGRFAENPTLNTGFEGFDVPYKPIKTWDHENLMALGQYAFEHYPLQQDQAAGLAIQNKETIQASGVWQDNRGRIGGLVRVKSEDGKEHFSKTCATCHAAPTLSGDLIHGRSHADFNLGRLLTWKWPDWPELGTWGPGQVDVTSDGSTNPAAIIDLRPIRYQKRLHWAATLHNSLPALAVRVDTLIITSLGRVRRPPREVSFAIAYYLWHMGEPAKNPRKLTEQETRGELVFEQNCIGCHKADGTTGEPVALDIIGTDPLVGLSTARGTGTYRVPSLWKVADRTQFFHHGKIRSLPALLAPDRLETVSGHPFGLDLNEAQRTELIAFIKTIGNR